VIRVQLGGDRATILMWVLLRIYGLEVPANWELPHLQWLEADQFWPLRAIWTDP
jgi:hypothetical protein